MSERGVFAVDRGIFTDPDFANEPFTEREAFLWLIAEAAWKPRSVRAGVATVDLARGQLCHSIRFMAEAWQWSKSRVDRFVSKLEKRGTIVSGVAKNRDTTGTASGTGQTVITVCNYDTFQRISLPERDSKNAHPGTTAGQQRDKLEDIKNIQEQTPSDPKGSDAPQGGRQKRGSVCPSDFQPSDAHYAKAATRQRSRAFVDDFAQRMVSWSIANKNRKVARKADWDQAFHNWLDKALDEADDRDRRGNSSAGRQQHTRRSPLTMLADQLGLSDDQLRHDQNDFGSVPVLDLAAYGGPDCALQELLGGDPERSSAQAYPRLAYAARR